MVFLIPFAGWATGAGLGALFGHLRDKGIDHAFQRQVRDSVQKAAGSPTARAAGGTGS